VTYFGFLLAFVVPPLALLALAAWRDEQVGRPLPDALTGFPWPWVILAHVVVAVLYTTPWDNHLVATGVWYYDPALVTGIVLGYVPLEEYCFFVLQTLLTGLWLVWLARRLTPPAWPAPGEAPPRGTWPLAWRLATVAALALPWLWSMAALARGWADARYLALILVWALPPILLQLGFGADILWAHRRLVLAAIAVPTLWLAAADTLAIASGTWTIHQTHSLGVLLPGGLPVEELVFFLLTNVLLAFGVTLVLACESRRRAGLAGGVASGG
jgi:lycopene cyclase domain-containing protein